ncbi:SDR family NAD(P)-dependent oxidoreductase [Paraburkholderia caledonica]
MNRLKGKAALITGAASGIGKATAKLLASQGARTIVADLNGVAGSAVVNEIIDAGGIAEFQQLDVSDDSSWLNVIKFTKQTYGKLDVLVNVAGVSLIKPISDTTSDEFDFLFKVNVRGSFLGIKHAASAMKLNKAGSIINISSSLGIVGCPNQSVYIASKGAVRSLTKGVAAELANFNIRVNSVHPGFIETNMTKELISDEAVKKMILGPTLMARAGQPEEIANAILFLASDESSYMTGSELVVDGGYTAV